jgi:hypothetical protein
MATNNAPDTNLSMLLCCLECQYTGAIFRKIKNPVLDLLVNLSPAWSESMNKQMSISLPLGFGAFMGIASIPIEHLPVALFEGRHINLRVC